MSASPAPSASSPAIREQPGALTIEVKVVPRASRDRIGPMVGGRIKVQLTAPPVDGAANEALRALWAKAVGVPRSAVSVVRGETSRDKTLRIAGVAPAAVLALLEVDK